MTNFKLNFIEQEWCEGDMGYNVIAEWEDALTTLYTRYYPQRHD